MSGKAAATKTWSACSTGPKLLACRSQVRRRLPKRIYVPLPDPEARRSMIQHLLKGQRCKLSGRELERIVSATGGRVWGLFGRALAWYTLRAVRERRERARPLATRLGWPSAAIAGAA